MPAMKGTGYFRETDAKQKQQGQVISQGRLIV